MIKHQKTRAIVSSIEPDSIASDLEIMPGDVIVSINETIPQDLLDYQYLTASEDLSLHICRSSGEEEIIDIEKDAEEDLGINFDSAVFDRIIPCNNRCIFCFVDQQPAGLRDSLYVKDDDYRLSYFQGTYITLTNLREKDKKRIENLRPGPLYISVHTTNPDLRCKMLQNSKAGDILQKLQWLNSLDIPVHAQIVLCPGINDGKELDKTLYNLAELHSNIVSIAVVPVGLTKYRETGQLKSISRTGAKEVIQQVQEFNKKLGYNLAASSDEFYIKAGIGIPEDRFYNGYGQLEDGVGASRLLIDDYKKNKKHLPKSLSKPFDITIATGKFACKVLEPIVEDLNKIKNLNVNTIPVESGFWGEDVTVSGLVTGKDLLENLLPLKDKITNLVIPSVMLKKYTNQFLDSISIEEVQEKLDVNIQIIENYYSVEELIDLIISNK